MRWRPKTFAVISAAAFVSMFALAFANHALNGDQPELPVLIAFGVLFLTFVYALMPLFVHLFVSLQGRVGNAELGPIRWAGANEKRISFGFWGVFTLGLMIAVPAMLLDLGVHWPVGKSTGVLTANVGMSLAEVRARSTLPIGEGSKVVGDGVFDFAIAGTPTRFERCRYYWLDTASHDAVHINNLNVGISAEKLSVAQLAKADAELSARLAHDGWHAGQFYYRTEEQQHLHGGETSSGRGVYWLNGGTILHLEHNRMDEEKRGEDPKTAGEWIQYIELWPRSERIFEHVEFDE
jgi:hypothetical protein